MPITLVLHIAAGGVALAAGFIALLGAKGGRLHRRGGMVFVYAMVAMGSSGTLVAAARGIEASVLAGFLVSYLVVTALLAVRPPGAGTRRMDGGMMVLGWAVAAALFAVGFVTLATPGGTLDGIPAAPNFLNGTVVLLASVGDVRVVRAGPPQGRARLARHLWRMCYALWIASASFFLGQADELPEAMRIPALLAIPVLAPLVVMAYWLWRVRRRAPASAPAPRRVRAIPFPLAAVADANPGT